MSDPPIEALTAMMTDLESDIVERKESLRGDAPVKIRQAVCAFANDLPDRRRPGVVFVGANDDGRPVGGDISDELLRQLADIKTDGNIVPPPTMVVEPRMLAGARVAVVTVRPSDSPPVRYQGRIWVRVGPRRAVASAQDERILSEKRRHRDPHFDARRAPTARLADLSLRRFEEEYLPSAVDAETLASNDRSTEERLAAAKMIVSVDDPVPTVGGVLVLGKRPQDSLPGAYAQFLRVAGTEFGDPVTDTEACQGVIADVVRRLDDKLVAHNRTSVDFLSGPVEIRNSTYPLDAVQQLVRNAVMHRTYEGSNAPTHVYWFDDRIEIGSPGGPYGAVNAGNFGQPGGGRLQESDSRRGDAGARPGATIRVRHTGRAPAPACRRTPRAGVPRRSELGALHGASARLTRIANQPGNRRLRLRLLPNQSAGVRAVLQRRLLAISRRSPA